MQQQQQLLIKQQQLIQQQQQQQQTYVNIGGKRIDEETGLELCEKHVERVKHFFCLEY